MKPILGFIGLGIMGKPMVRNLVRGFEVHVYSLVPADVAEVIPAGAIAALSPADVARKAEIIITMVPNTPDVEKVLFGENGIAAALVPGKVVIDMSTISPISTRAFAAKIGRTGAQMLDAPVSGGEKGAIEGTLSIMVGGERGTYERCLPVFQTLGRRITHVGGHGAGQVVKACNQVLAASTVVAMGEALVLGTKAGVDPEKIVEVLSAGAARCWALEVRAPHVLDRDFDPGFRSRLQYKDLGLALELSRDIDAPMPLAGIVHEFYKSCIGKGFGDSDHTAVIKVIEELAGIEIRRRTT